MSIIKLFWQTIVLLICSLIQVVGVIVEGVAKMLLAVVDILVMAHDQVMSWKTIGKKKVHTDTPCEG